MYGMKTCCLLSSISIGVFLFYEPLYAKGTKPNVLEVIPPSTGGEFSITHHTIDSGYKEMNSGQYRLRGIVGQAEPGVSEGNDTVFVSGFLRTDTPLFSSFLFEDSFESP